MVMGIQFQEFEIRQMVLEQNVCDIDLVTNPIDDL